jgi:hypothetical protein
MGPTFNLIPSSPSTSRLLSHDHSHGRLLLRLPVAALVIPARPHQHLRRSTHHLPCCSRVRICRRLPLKSPRQQHQCAPAVAATQCAGRPAALLRPGGLERHRPASGVLHCMRMPGRAPPRQQPTPAARPASSTGHNWTEHRFASQRRRPPAPTHQPAVATLDSWVEAERRGKG